MLQGHQFVRPDIISTITLETLVLNKGWQLSKIIAIFSKIFTAVTRYATYPLRNQCYFVHIQLMRNHFRQKIFFLRSNTQINRLLSVCSPDHCHFPVLKSRVNFYLSPRLLINCVSYSYSVTLINRSEGIRILRLDLATLRDVIRNYLLLSSLYKSSCLFHL